MNSILAPTEDLGSAHEREGLELVGGEDELHKSLAVAAGLRGLALRRQVSRRKKRRTGKPEINRSFEKPFLSFSSKFFL